jgi:hypothetical protein
MYHNVLLVSTRHLKGFYGTAIERSVCTTRVDVFTFALGFDTTIGQQEKYAGKFRNTRRTTPTMNRPARTRTYGVVDVVSTTPERSVSPARTTGEPARLALTSSGFYLETCQYSHSELATLNICSMLICPL